MFLNANEIRLKLLVELLLTFQRSLSFYGRDLQFLIKRVLNTQINEPLTELESKTMHTDRERANLSSNQIIRLNLACLLDRKILVKTFRLKMKVHYKLPRCSFMESK